MGGFLFLMRVVAIPMADPQLELHWVPDPGILIQGFLIQCLRRIRELLEARTYRWQAPRGLRLRRSRFDSNGLLEWALLVRVAVTEPSFVHVDLRDAAGWQEEARGPQAQEAQAAAREAVRCRSEAAVAQEEAV